MPKGRKKKSDRDSRRVRCIPRPKLGITRLVTWHGELNKQAIDETTPLLEEAGFFKSFKKQIRTCHQKMRPSFYAAFACFVVLAVAMCLLGSLLIKDGKSTEHYVIGALLSVLGVMTIPIGGYVVKKAMCEAKDYSAAASRV